MQGWLGGVLTHPLGVRRSHAGSQAGEAIAVEMQGPAAIAGGLNTVCKAGPLLPPHLLRRRACGIPVSTDVDVMYLTNYQGKDLMERSLRRILSEQGSWWATEIDDLIQKHAGGVLAQCKLDQINDLLSSETTGTWAMLTSATSTFADVKASCRSQRLGNIQDGFVAAWQPEFC